MKQSHDEDLCRSYLPEVKEKQAIVCKECRGKKHHWLKAKGQGQCFESCFRTAFRSGTVKGNTKLVMTWYLALWLCHTAKRAIAVAELQRQWEHTRHDSTWSFLYRMLSIRLRVGAYRTALMGSATSLTVDTSAKGRSTGIVLDYDTLFWYKTDKQFSNIKTIKNEKYKIDRCFFYPYFNSFCVRKRRIS